MTSFEAEGNGRLLRWRLDRVEARLTEIEKVKPELLAYEIAQLNKKLAVLTKVFVTVGISTVTGAILLAFNLTQGSP